MSVMILCRACRSEIPSTVMVCPHCREIEPAGRYKSKTIAGALAVGLGGLGAHHFYLGRWLWGLFYLLFCWTYIPALLGWVEGIGIVLTRQHVWDRKYNQGIPGESSTAGIVIVLAIAGLAGLIVIGGAISLVIWLYS